MKEFEEFKKAMIGFSIAMIVILITILFFFIAMPWISAFSDLMEYKSNKWVCEKQGGEYHQVNKEFYSTHECLLK
jgi:hypothetical protein